MEMVYIEDILAREVLDSRGNPTVELNCVTETKTDIWAKAYSKQLRT